MDLDYKDLYNIILDSSQLKKPKLYTVKMIKENIYHPIGENKYLGFHLNKNDRLSSINSNGDICEFNSYFFSKWKSKNHIDIYVTGSSQSLSKFDIVCGGSLDQSIPFNLDTNESRRIRIRDTEFKMKRKSEKFVWEDITDVETDMNFDINKLKTNGFNYNILTVNCINKINNINFLD